jgi:hypothetical protein
MELAMNRFFAGTLVASAVALAVGACGDDSSNYGYAPGGDCSAYTTCGTCTPVQGCGWCFNKSGGLCTTDPNECANVSEFTWTWNPSGCPDVDASVNPVDGGTSPEASPPSTGSGSAATDGGGGPPTHPADDAGSSAD